MQTRAIGDLPFHRYELGDILLVREDGRPNSWICTDKESDRKVVLKTLASPPPEAVDRWVGRKLTGHATILELGRSDDWPFVIRQWVEGTPLDEIKKRLPETEARRLLADAAGTLAGLHELNEAHGAIKPSNLISTPMGIVVTDPFLERASDAGAKKDEKDGAPSMICCNPLFAHPEIAQSRPAVPASDVYSLGCILYQFLTGAPPFQTPIPVLTLYQHIFQPVPSLKNACPEASDEMCAIIEKALAKKPEDRYPDARAFRMALAPHLADPDAEKTSPLPTPLPAKARPASVSGPKQSSTVAVSRRRLYDTIRKIEGQPQRTAKEVFTEMEQEMARQSPEDSIPIPIAEEVPADRKEEFINRAETVVLRASEINAAAKPIDTDTEVPTRVLSAAEIEAEADVARSGTPAKEESGTVALPRVGGSVKGVSPESEGPTRTGMTPVVVPKREGRGAQPTRARKVLIVFLVIYAIAVTLMLLYKLKSQ